MHGRQHVALGRALSTHPPAFGAPQLGEGRGGTWRRDGDRTVPAGLSHLMNELTDVTLETAHLRFGASAHGALRPSEGLLGGGLPSLLAEGPVALTFRCFSVLRPLGRAFALREPQRYCRPTRTLWVRI